MKTGIPIRAREEDGLKEPHVVKGTVLQAIAFARNAITGIRNVKAENSILVPTISGIMYPLARMGVCPMQKHVRSVAVVIRQSVKMDGFIIAHLEVG